MEEIEIHHATRHLCGEVEEHETLSAEVGHVVVHLEGAADGLPVFSVEAIEEGCLVGTFTEVVIYTGTAGTGQRFAIIRDI